MVKKQLRRSKIKQRDTLSKESHYEVFRRLARIRQGEMHGTPGERKKKGK